MNSKINKVDEKALKIAYKDYISDFDTLLERDKIGYYTHEEFTNHNDRNISNAEQYEPSLYEWDL